jgi:hypothetical protein
MIVLLVMLIAFWKQGGRIALVGHVLGYNFENEGVP